MPITGAYGRREKTVPTATFGAVFNDDRFVTSDWRGFVDAALDRRGVGPTTPFAAMSTATGTTARIHTRRQSTGEPNVLATDYGYGTWWGAEGRATRKLPGRQTLTAGLEFRDYADQAQGEAFEEDPADNWDSDVTTRVFAAYGQDEVRLREKWLVSFGGRYDAYSGFDRLSPRASVVFGHADARFQIPVRIGLSRAERVRVRLFQPGGSQHRPAGRDDHDARIRLGGVHRRLASHHGVRVSQHVSHLLELTVNDVDETSFENQGRVLARGLEFEAESGAPAVFLGSYAFQRARDRDTDLELTNSPRHLGKLRGASGPVGESTLSLELQTTSQRLTVARPSSVACGRERALRHPINSRLALTATLRNLLADYADPVSQTIG